jgi:excisionase family DNA binding protein
MSDTKEFLTPEEVAEKLRLHINTVYNQLKNGAIKGKKYGDSWRIPSAQFETKEEK